MEKLDSVTPCRRLGGMVDVMGQYDACSSFAVFPCRTAPADVFGDGCVAAHRVSLERATGMVDAVLAMKQSAARHVQTIVAVEGSHPRSMPWTFALRLADRCRSRAPLPFVSQRVEHACGPRKAPIVVLAKSRLAETEPGKRKVRLIVSTAVTVLRVASIRETVFCPVWDPMKGGV
ncbi:hypothetical protein [Sphingomonas sp. R86520]|uniref:hypothetical protein n=1 Tax=Sphingomonas sp. R86520 TaxID=3093859 RepID=UPI0036D211C9